MVGACDKPDVHTPFRRNNRVAVDIRGATRFPGKPSFHECVPLLRRNAPFGGPSAQFRRVSRSIEFAPSPNTPAFPGINPKGVVSARRRGDAPAAYPWLGPYRRPWPQMDWKIGISREPTALRYGTRANPGFQGSPRFTSAALRYAETAPLGHVPTHHGAIYPAWSACRLGRALSSWLP